MPARNLDRWPGDRHEFTSIAHFLSEPVPSGLISIDYNGWPLDIKHEPKPGSDSTLVMFHAATSSSVRFLPIFTGAGVTKGLDSHVVRISDPSLCLDPELELAWFAGNQHQRLQEDLPAVIEHIRLSHDSQKLTFFGSSGGGFAAAYYGAKFPDSLVISVNPQFDIAKYTPSIVRDYTAACFGAATEDASLAALSGVESNLNPIYAAGTQNRLAIVQNAPDTHHVKEHLLPFLDVVPGADNIAVMFGDWGKGHKAPPADLIAELLALACGRDDSGTHALASFGFKWAPTTEVARGLRSAAQNANQAVAQAH